MEESSLYKIMQVMRCTAPRGTIYICQNMECGPGIIHIMALERGLPFFL